MKSQITESNEIRLIKRSHRGELSIFLLFEHRWDWLKIIKQLPKVKFSASYGLWYLPYTKDSYQDFISLGLPFEIPDSATNQILSTKQGNNNKHHNTIDNHATGTTEITDSLCEHTGIASQDVPSAISPIGEEENTDIDQGNDMNIVLNGGVFQLKLPYDKNNVVFIKSLKAAWWHNASKLWIIQANMENLQSLQMKFGLWDEISYSRVYDLISLYHDPIKVELYQTPEAPKMMAVKISGFKADIDFMKHIPSRHYSKEYKRWLVPNDIRLVERIKKHYEAQGAEIVDRLVKNQKFYKRGVPSLKNRQDYLLGKLNKEMIPVLKLYTDTLIAQRYSWRTIQSYSGAFVKYLQAKGTVDVSEHSASDVNQYLANISAQKISESTINRAYSAIKFYFEKVIFRPDFEIKKLKRLRKGRYLPTILSVQEVSRILSATDNLKHTTILYTLYSSGMRLAELLSLRLIDILWDRDQILIKAGKGKKDRIVMLSKTLKEILLVYCEEYKPEYWLFEGQDKQRQYSETSVQQVVRKAARGAGITKKVTPHTLRHCFATHLLDKGTSIRYIQELLGHKDIKTTLIYTHVTTAKISEVQSPLDDMDISLKKNTKSTTK